MTDYDALIKALREKAEFLTVSDANKAPPNIKVKNLFAESMKQAADAIEDLVAALEINNEAINNHLRWISVTERLPLKGDDVLCFGDNGISIAAFVAGDKWCVLPWFYVDGEQETGVTNWMPLPEPPKEDGK